MHCLGDVVKEIAAMKKMHASKRYEIAARLAQ